MCYRKLIVYIGYFVILCCVQCRCWGQLSVPNVLQTPFDQQNTPSIFNLRSINPDEPINSYLKSGVMSELTARTNETGKGRVQDFHTNGHYNVASWHPDKRSRLTVAKSNLATKYFLNDTHTQVDASGKLSIQSIMYESLLKNNWSVRISGASQDYYANGSTNLYNNIFGIFTNTPPLTIEKNVNGVSVDLRSPYYRGWRSEIIYSLKNSPGKIYLNNSGDITSLTLPLSDSGSEYIFAVDRRLSHDTNIVLYNGHGSWFGNDRIMREGNQSIGTGSNRRSQDNTGIGLIKTAKGYQWNIFFNSYHNVWNTEGQIPHGYDLGLSVPFAGNIIYKAAYDLRVNTLGINYSHEISSNHNIDIGYRWITARPWFGSSYSLNILFVPTGDETEIGGEWFRSHEIQLGYTVRCHNISYRFECNQLIPVATNSGSSNSGGSGSSSKTGSKTSDGGRYIGFSVTTDF